MADILGICAGANMCTSLGALYYAVDITLVGSSLFHHLDYYLDLHLAIQFSWCW